MTLDRLRSHGFLAGHKAAYAALATAMVVGLVVGFASFRILRVLKGPVRSNLRVRVGFGGDASCGTTVVQTEYLLRTIGGGVPVRLSLCNEHLRGAAVVREARDILGPGTVPPRRADVGWLLPWVALGAVPVVVVGRLLRRRRTDMGRAPE